MTTIVWRCPNCHPRYRVVRLDGKRSSWVVRADYVGYLSVAGVKTPPKVCPECGTTLVRTGV